MQAWRARLCRAPQPLFPIIMQPITCLTIKHMSCLPRVIMAIQNRWLIKNAKIQPHLRESVGDVHISTMFNWNWHSLNICTKINDFVLKYGAWKSLLPHWYAPNFRVPWVWQYYYPWRGEQCTQYTYWQLSQLSWAEPMDLLTELTLALNVIPSTDH